MEVDYCKSLYSSCSDALPGKYGIQVGNQQFTVRNLTVNNAAVGLFSCPLTSRHALNIHIHRQLSPASGIGVRFNVAKFRTFLTIVLGFTFQGVTINNCQVRLEIVYLAEEI
jgi:hypothetical protein